MFFMLAVSGVSSSQEAWYFQESSHESSVLAPNPGLFTQILSEIELEFPGKRFQTFYK
jgi:hypothetical protein